ncbi:hypothetical protein LCGC14_1113660 [marine sediment metagenome]|uniref:Uncharacterized protein n=1 Tax=marine sediment metagenome TaxID=412755 RepID=A0A0F9MTZ8_9ZZZZ
MSNDKLREIVSRTAAMLKREGNLQGDQFMQMCGDQLRVALADTADATVFADGRPGKVDAPENDQMVRAREQAGGLDHWARCLEAHEPESSAAGIVMLHEAAKTLRRFADAPQEVTEELRERIAWIIWASGCNDYSEESWDTWNNPEVKAIRAAAKVKDYHEAADRILAVLATAQKEG